MELRTAARASVANAFRVRRRDVSAKRLYGQRWGKRRPIRIYPPQKWGIVGGCSHIDPIADTERSSA